MTATSAIVGLGLTEMGKVYGRTITDFAGEAIALALEDAGLEKSDLDGLLVNANGSTEMVPMLQLSLGLENLTLVNAMNAAGSTAGNMVQWATQAIDAGQANVDRWIAQTPPGQAVKIRFAATRDYVEGVRATASLYRRAYDLR